MRNRHWTIGDGGRCRLNQMSGRASPQELVDVKNAESEDERVDGAEDDERNRRLARGQERRHCVGRSQDAVDHPGLSAHFRRVPAGEDGKEGQREAEKHEPKDEAVPLTSRACSAPDTGPKLSTVPPKVIPGTLSTVMLAVWPGHILAICTSRKLATTQTFGSGTIRPT